MNEDALPADLSKDFDPEQYIVPTHLADATEDGGLFGIRFGLAQWLSWGWAMPTYWFYRIADPNWFLLRRDKGNFRLAQASTCQLAEAWWFPVDHNQLIWCGFLSKSFRKGKDMLTEMRLRIDDSILLSLKESKGTFIKEMLFQHAIQVISKA